MIIIEEDELIKNNIKKMAEEEPEEVLTPEEEQYRSALALMESVDCITRFERGVKSLQAAAALFDNLGEYRDSTERAADCRRRANQMEGLGREQAYKKALVLFEQAQTRMDYRTVITELERFPDYKDCPERIERCKQEITRLETRFAWRNRGIILLGLVLLGLGIWLVQLYFF